MRVELTKDADKMLCILYKEYLQRRKDGMSKDDAVRFEEGCLNGIRPMSGWSDADIWHIQQELAKNSYLKERIDGSCLITDETICELENRFKNGLKDVVSFLSLFVP